jgi:hypothetical protein
MSETAHWEGDPELPTLVLSDQPLITKEDGEVDGEVIVLFDSGLVPNYGGRGFHRERTIRQVPSSIILGEQQ